MRTKRLAVALATLLIPAASLLAQGPDVIKSLVNGQTTNRTNIGLIGADLIANAAHDREQDATILRLTQVVAELKEQKGSLDTATATADPAAIEAAVKAAIAKYAPASSQGSYYRVIKHPENAAKWILGAHHGMTDSELKALCFRLLATDINGDPATPDIVTNVNPTTMAFTLHPKGVEKLISRLTGYAIHHLQEQITALRARVDGIDGRLVTLEGQFADLSVADACDLDALESRVTALEGGGGLASTNAGLITSIDGRLDAIDIALNKDVTGVHHQLKLAQANFQHFGQRADETDEARRLRIQTLEATKADTIEGVNVLNRQAVVLGMAKLSGKGNHREIREEAANVAAKIKTATALIAATDAEITYLQGLLTPPPPAATP